MLPCGPSYHHWVPAHHTQKSKQEEYVHTSSWTGSGDLPVLLALRYPLAASFIPFLAVLTVNLEVVDLSL